MACPGLLAFFRRIPSQLVVAAWMLASASADGQITFGSPMDYPVGTTPGAVAAGDFNADHKLDMAVANAGSNDISILLGNGDGTFEPAVSYSVGLDPVSIAVVDLNGDHNEDLVIAFHGDAPSQQLGGVSLLLGNGDGTFRTTQGLASSDYPQAIVAGDLNGDGNPDLAIADIDASISVYLGNSNGTFRSAGKYAVTGDPSSIFIGDFNSDGKQDLLVTTGYSPAIDEFAGKASVLLGNGNGTFQSVIETDLGGSGGTGAVADFNGDHILDLTYITKFNVYSVPSIAVALGQGDGRFAKATVVDANNFDSFLIVDDIDNDGLADLIALSYPVIPALRLFAGNGDGTFQLTQTVVFQNFGPTAAVIGDFNGDQLHDVAVAMTPQNVVSVLRNTTIDFTLSASALTPPKLSPGQSATSTVTLSAANGFAGSISLACSVQPTPSLAPQCAINPTSLNPGTTATLMVSTTGPQAELTPGRGLGWVYALWPPIYGIMVMVKASAASHGKRGLANIGLQASLIIALLLVNGCGGGSETEQHQSNPGTPKGQYSIVVTATSGALRHPTTVILTVQ